MKLIAHRGLMNGPDPSKENTIEQIDLALKEGFDVEVDVWWSNGRFWLGHDAPTTEVEYHFLKQKGLWIHCKNVNALDKMVRAPKRLNYFWHHIDEYTLTSKGYPWVYPGKQLLQDGVCVLPEETMELKDVTTLDVYGICSDYVAEIKEILK